MIHEALEYPAEPDTDDAGTDAAHLRYDDLIQDGRLRLEATWRSTGRLLHRHADVARVYAAMSEGVTTVLARTIMEAGEAPLVPRADVRTRARYRFLHTLDASGDIDRILFLTWLESFAQGRSGREELAGRAYGQRVFTRLGAAPGDHLVRRLPAFEPDGVPPHRGRWESSGALLELPRGAEALDVRPRVDPNRVVFGLSHTDLNQHVNFLMYHRAVESAALGRFVDLGLGSLWVSRHATFAYRKPSFAGEAVRVVLRAFRLGELLGVVAAVTDDDRGAPERPGFRDFPAPRCVARMVFRP